MTADPIFFRDLAYVFVAALIGGGLAWLTRQPLVLGYVVGGILINPSADTLLRPGDRVRLFGLPEQIRAFAAGADGREAGP